MQDHLFISYAGEDWCFVEWLALRLAAEGYKVWCDRIKLLGGESYPRDIDAAIKNRTFRFLAILSRNSIQKPNPVKERTLALNLARERQENFLIPINLDGLSASELDWMVSDLTYIPFNLSWAQGLAQLLKQLVKSNAPMSFPNGRSAAADWFNSNNLLVRRKERLWSNVAEIVEYPRDFYRFEIDPRTPVEQRLELLREWPYFAESDVLWSFESPTQRMMTKYRFEREGKINDWRSRSADERHVRYIAVRLFNESLRSICLRRGLRFTAGNQFCYFPDGLLAHNRLEFQGYDNKMSWVGTVGVRTFKTSVGKEQCRYHLVPIFKVWLDSGAVQLRIRLFLTTLEGTPLDAKPAFRRRKAICRNWWNYEWLVRTLALFQFVAGNNRVIRIGKRSTQQLVIIKSPTSFEIDQGLDEATLTAEPPETENLEDISLSDDTDDEEKPNV